MKSPKGKSNSVKMGGKGNKVGKKVAVKKSNVRKSPAIPSGLVQKKGNQGAKHGMTNKPAKKYGATC